MKKIKTIITVLICLVLINCTNDSQTNISDNDLIVEYDLDKYIELEGDSEDRTPSFEEIPKDAIGFAWEFDYLTINTDTIKDKSKLANSGDSIYVFYTGKDGYAIIRRDESNSIVIDKRKHVFSFEVADTLCFDCIPFSFMFENTAMELREDKLVFNSCFYSTEISEHMAQPYACEGSPELHFKKTILSNTEKYQIDSIFSISKQEKYTSEIRVGSRSSQHQDYKILWKLKNNSQTFIEYFDSTFVAPPLMSEKFILNDYELKCDINIDTLGKIYKIIVYKSSTVEMDSIIFNFIQNAPLIDISSMGNYSPDEKYHISFIGMRINEQGENYLY